jgi:hypothetical protein
MARYYTQLECGCLISCDGGGGLISVCGTFDEESGCQIPSPECKVDEYLKEHKMCGGCCKICDPQGYATEKIYWDKYYKEHPEEKNED